MKEVFEKIDSTKEELRVDMANIEKNIKTELRAEMANIEKNIKTELRTEMANIEKNIKTELRAEMANIEKSIKTELRTEIAKGDAELKREIQYLKLDLNEKYNDLRESIFYLENSLGGKLDTICDFIKVQMEKNNESSDSFSKVHKKIENNELKILNHEDRIKFLEKKLNRAN